MARLTRNDKNNDNAQKEGILRLLSATARYIKRKVKSIYKKLVKKEPKKTDKEVYNEENLKRKSIDVLKEIAKLKRSKNRGKLKKEGLIISILKSEGSNTERNYMKHFNTNVNNNTNVNTNNDDVNNSTNDHDDDAYDGKIKDKISDIRAILSRLGDIVTKNDRKKIKKELYEIENKKNLSDKEKEKNYDNLFELVNKLNKREKYKYHERDDLDYHGIRDIENSVENIDDDYYKPISVESSFKENYKYYESRGDKNKKLSVEQYLDMIKPYLSDLINENKAIEISSTEWKIQRNMYVKLVSSNDN